MTDTNTPPGSRLSSLVEATRLTRAGRVQEATALLQRTFESSEARRTPPSGNPLPAPLDALAGSLTTLAPERLRNAVGAVTRSLGPVLKGLGGVGQGWPVQTKNPGHGSFTEHAFANSAGARDYKLFVPDGAGLNLPLIVMLHGCGQSPDDFAAGTRMNALAEIKGFLVAYPAQTSRAHGQRCWNWYQPGDQGRDSGESAIIAGITREVIANHRVDPTRVYIAGLSAGGAAAANIARAYPDLYAAVGVHSGLAAGCASDVASALTIMRLGPVVANTTDLAPAAARVPTIVIHGESDSTVHPSNGEQVLTQAGADFLDAASESKVSSGRMPYTVTRYADTAGRVRVESWLVRGLGHAWSGGDSSGTHTDPRGPDASHAMAEFFLARRLGA